MKTWRDTEHEYLSNAAGTGLTVEAMAYALGRSRSAVYSKLNRLGLTKGKTPWPEGSVEFAINQLESGATRNQVRHRLMVRYGIVKNVASSIIRVAIVSYERRFGAPLGKAK
jgi:hypothetical protein